MDKHYDAHAVEEKWYAWWEKNNLFHANADDPGEPYSVVIPPPNITGILHMGHALNNIIQDVLVRWRRMQGRNTVWMPGTDHAGIATQNVVERALRKQNLTRHSIGREKFIEHVWEWRADYGDTIVKQLRKLGASCDWQRERFTMDQGLSEAVTEVFCRLYDEKLIYRGNYIVNWCPRCHTALSDEESEHQETEGNLWHIKYPVKESDEFVTVATTRPETMLGDTAVAVHPDDERYQHLIGKCVILPLLNREIPVVADTYVDREFGTGVVKITPAHDPNDFQVAERHHLPAINVMHGDGTMNEEAGKYAGMDRFACRKQVIKDLEESQLLCKTESHHHAVGHCYRCDTVVEPRLSKQWFVHMKPLAEPAIEAVRSGRIRFTPQRWEKTYFEWMENIRDWCISRQIWWGHRIPVYTCKPCGHEWAARTTPDHCPQCSAGADEITQDEDVLDTWFSSWLWPFSTFGWPAENPDLGHYYPTSDLTTAPDIIFFWVARMIMAGCKFMSDIPFKNVYIHGIVRDDKGRKMSKSLGNSIDPLDIVDQYSTDALRFTLMLITSTGMDVYVNMEKFEIGRNFATKIWNAARFMRSHMDKMGGINWHTLANAPLKLDTDLLRDDDRHLLDKYDHCLTTLTNHLERFRMQDGALEIYDFIWSNFCDWYLEFAKQDLYGNDPDRKYQTMALMTHVFARSLKLLHPYMPFITEELWHQLGYGTPDESIMRAPWPDITPAVQAATWGISSEITAFVEAKRELITASRALRAEYNIAPSQKITFIVQAVDQPTAERLQAEQENLLLQLKAEKLEISVDAVSLKATPGTLVKLGTISMPLEGLVDQKAEQERLANELEQAKKYLQSVEAKLNNPNFVDKAPAKVVEQQQMRKKELVETIARLQQLYSSFG